MNKKKKISVVIACYKDEKAIPVMYKRLKEGTICLLWIIFVPIAYSVKILSYMLLQIKKFLIMFNNKIKNN